MRQDKAITQVRYDAGDGRRGFSPAPFSGHAMRTDAVGACAAPPPRAMTLVIAGGGTGGHLFPGIAVAEEVLAANRNSHVYFVGTGNRFETRILGEKGFEQKCIRVRSLKGKSVFQQIQALASLPGSIAGAAGILKKHRPDVVLGVGGYSAGPVVLAARMLRIPAAIQEQNAIPGITNRMLSRFVNRIYVSFENTRIKAPLQKIRMTGNPVRKDIRSCFDNTPAVPRGPATPETPFTVFIVGGSQGAHRINTAVMEALGRIQPKDSFAFIHQTGAADLHVVRKAYAHHHIRGTVKPFFDQMETPYREADLVICRAGASTIAELTILGKGVIFVPYPFAADDHQAVNARRLVGSGAAELILEKDLSGELLAKRIEHYALAPEKLAVMSGKMKQQAHPDAAKEIAADIFDLATQKGASI